MNRIALALIAIVLTACSEEEGTSYDAGYDDGHASGYNSFCKLRTTLIWGNFDYPEYARGFADGEIAGVADAKALACKG